MMTALIDAEAACHACAHAAPDVDAAANAAIGRIHNWIDAVRADRAILAFSCPRAECFRRTELLPTYKSTREKKPTHPFVAPVIDSVKRTFASGNRNRRATACVTRPRIEADDVLGMLATWPDREGDTVVVARDEDMLQLPGLHYRLGGKGEPDLFVEVSEDQADYAFMLAAIVGCSGDDVPGCPREGEKTAPKLFLGVAPANRWGTVVRAFKKKGLGEQEALTQARLVRVLRWGDYDPATSAVRFWSPGR